MPDTVIPNNTYVVCYMDLLGYGEIVSKLWRDEVSIKKVGDVFERALNAVEGMWTKSKAPREFSEAKKLIWERMSVRLISDSLLMTGSLSNAPLLDKRLSHGANLMMYIEGLLMSACVLYWQIAGHLGHLFRGAITVGQYHESHPVNRSNLFVFSKALVDAVNLERTASYPRVLIGQSIDDFVARFDGGDPLKEDGWIYEDQCDGSRCLNIYGQLEDSESKKILQTFRDFIPRHIEANDHKPNIARKYRWFKNYHNQWLSDKPHLKDLVIPE